MEPPSRQLIDLLTQYGLATSRDLRRCRPLVRRLARDLPTFDSVWIDALTQIRTITPFQARLLESNEPHRLQVGPCILVDEWERDGRWTLCLARHRGNGRKCLLTYFKIPVDNLPRARDSVRDLVSGLRGLSHSSIVVPQGCDEVSGRLVVVNPYTSGPTLHQLLVRRGRFPISVVTEIARQLLDALATLEGIGIVHGDLSLTGVRLSNRGHTILLNPGVMPAVGSLVSFHDAHPPEAYDGTAPELISTGRTATLASDLYALGCLLWHLLAGRPPFPTGDPLSKLAAHQSRPLDDVRRWRPDTPDALATIIARVTQKDPELRPSGPREVRDTVRLGPHGGRPALARFHASFGAVAPRHSDSYRSAARFPWPVAATLLLVLSGLSLSLLDAGARNELLRLASRVTESSPASIPDANSIRDASTTAGGHPLLPMPNEPVGGVIELNSSGPYAATEIVTARPLTIRPAAGVSPAIVITDRPLRITAPSLSLSGIRFLGAESNALEVQAAAAGSRSTSLISVTCQQISVNDCEFDRGESVGAGTSIAWKVSDEADPTGGRFVARNTWFSGKGGALAVQSLPRVIGFDNCLKQGDGPLVLLANWNRSTPLRVHLRQSTLRDSGGIIRWTADAADDSIQPVLIVVENSVFAPRLDTAGLLEFAANAPPGWERLLQITGEGSLLRSGTPLVISPSGPVEASQLRVEGLIIDEFEFADDGGDPTASLVTATGAPRSTPTAPGIDPSRFPIAEPTPVVRQASREYNDP